MALRRCLGCGDELAGNNSQRTCSDRCRKRIQRRKPTTDLIATDAGDWPSTFAATLSRLSISQRQVLANKIESDPQLAVSLDVPSATRLELIALPPSELRRELGPIASLRDYGWEDGAALRDYIGRYTDGTGERPATEA
jgi:hypothetical protein